MILRDSNAALERGSSPNWNERSSKHSTTYVNPVDKGGKGMALAAFLRPMGDELLRAITPVKKFTKSIFAFETNG